MHTHALWYSRAKNTDTEEKKLFNKVFIFVFFAHKKYSRCFVKLEIEIKMDKTLNEF